MSATTSGARGQAPAGASAATRHLFLIALDGADWQLIRPLVAQGRLPNLARLIEAGASGDLRTVAPAYSPVIWTSIATGTPVEQHGITEFWHEAPAGHAALSPEEQEHQDQLRALGYIGEQPERKPRMTLFRSSDRREPALWNLLGEQGLKSNVLAWWITYPAEIFPGVMVSDRYLYSRFALVANKRGMPYETDQALVSPPSIEPKLRAQVVRVDDVTAAELGRFIEGNVDLHPTLTLHAVEDELRIVYAKDQSVVRMARTLLEDEVPSFVAVYFQGLDITSHYFWKYRFPDDWNRKYPSDPILPQEMTRYSQVIDRYYEAVDQFIGEVLKFAKPSDTVLVCSDHGFVTGTRPPGTPGAAATVSGVHEEFAPPGILILSGGGIHAGSRIEGAQVYDIAPTVMTLFGLPIPPQMSGRPLTAALTGQPAS